MTTNYVKNACFPKEAPSEIRAPEEILESSSEASSNLPFIDASAYVSKIAPIPNGKRFSMARLFENPKIVALDFKDAKNMAETMNRMSHYVEQNGKRKVPTFKEAQSGEGHDLRISDIAHFYNACQNEGTILTQGERELLDHLLEAGLIHIQEDEYITPTSAALIGMSRSLDMFYKRKENFIHEYSHALYFVDPMFRSKVSKVFASFPPEVQSFLRGAILASGYYGSNDQWLIETETQAHSMTGPNSLDGFTNLILSAEKKCEAKKDLTQKCIDFRSYTGNIRILLKEIHEKYVEISKPHIPLLSHSSSTKSEEQTEDKNGNSNDTLKTLREINVEKFKNLKINTWQESLKKLEQEIELSHRYTQTDRPNPRKQLDQLQEEFDKRHGINFCRTE